VFIGVYRWLPLAFLGGPEPRFQMGFGWSSDRLKPYPSRASREFHEELFFATESPAPARI
jgi:hypothetical protein